MLHWILEQDSFSTSGLGKSFSCYEIDYEHIKDTASQTTIYVIFNALPIEQKAIILIFMYSIYSTSIKGITKIDFLSFYSSLAAMHDCNTAQLCI